MRRARFAVLAVAAMAFVGLGVAVAQVNTAGLQAYVVDQGGLALPGVTVTVAQVETGVAHVAVADEAGFVRVAALPPGGYTVKFELAGFNALEEKLVLRVGQTAKLTATMSETKAEQITVTAAAPIVDVMKMDTSSNIVPEQIAELPTPGRDFQNLAFIAPGVQRERGGYRFITGSPVVGSGGNASQSTILVDGVDYTDQALGLSRVRFSQDAIREFRVINNRFDSEIGGSAGGALSIVTRSGTNTVQGSAFGFYRADSLRTQGKLETGDQNFNRYQAGFTLGGPLKLDKSHYFASFEYINEDNITLFRPRGAFASQAEDVSHPFTQMLGLLSYSNQLSNAQNLQVKLVGDRYREDNFRVGGVADESSGMQLNRDNWNLNAGHTWLVSTSGMNNLNLQLGRKRFAEPNNSNAMAEYFTFGTTLITGANIVGDQDMTGDYFELRDTYHLYLTGKKSSHDVKLGISAQKIDEKWYFPVIPNGALFWANDTRALPYRYDYAVGEPSIKIGTKLYGAFVQDDWRLGRNFTVSLGVRYDYDTQGNNPDFTHPVEPEKRHVDDDNIQPRLSFAWDVGGDGSSVVRGGSGKFTGRYLLVPSFAELQQNGITGRTLYTRSTASSSAFPGVLDERGRPRAPPACCSSRTSPSSSRASKRRRRSSPASASPRSSATPAFSPTLEAVYVDGKNEIIVRDVNWSGNATHTPPEHQLHDDQRVHQRGTLPATRRSWPASTARSRAATSSPRR